MKRKGRWEAPPRGRTGKGRAGAGSVAAVGSAHGAGPPASVTAVIPAETYIGMYEHQLLAYEAEERTEAFVKANRCGFQASTLGHAKLQIAVGMAMEAGKDWFFPYYREKALAIALGMPLVQVFLHLLSRQGIPAARAAT